jgi:hypothetical protein
LVIVDGMYARSIAVEGNQFLQGLRSAYAAIERFPQFCVAEHGTEHIRAWGRKIASDGWHSMTDVSSDLNRIARLYSRDSNGSGVPTQDVVERTHGIAGCLNDGNAAQIGQSPGGGERPQHAAEPTLAWSYERQRQADFDR